MFRWALVLYLGGGAAQQGITFGVMWAVAFWCYCLSTVAILLLYLCCTVGSAELPLQWRHLCLVAVWQLWRLSCCVSEIYSGGWAGCLEGINHGTGCDGNALRLLFLLLLLQLLLLLLIIIIICATIILQTESALDEDCSELGRCLRLGDIARLLKNVCLYRNAHTLSRGVMEGSLFLWEHTVPLMFQWMKVLWQRSGGMFC